MNRQEFIDKALVEAVRARKEGATFSVPIAVAQAALETNFGRSDLCRDHNNLFGMKGDYHGSYVLMDTMEQTKDGTWYETQAKFRSYDSWRDSFIDYGDVIKRLPWYSDAEEAAHSPRDFLNGIITLRDESGEVIEPGWATDHEYKEKVWGLVEAYDLLDRKENPLEEEIVLLQLYENGYRLEYEPLKHTIGMTQDGGTKLMIRVKPKTFFEKLRYLFCLR